MSPERRASRSSSVSTAFEGLAPSATKSVAFIPLSPQSSRTLRKHHETHEQTERNAAPDSELEDQAAGSRRPALNRRRSDSDPSADRPLIHRRRRRRNESPHSGEGDVEVLPDRFDSAGRPINPHDPRRWHTRQGDFEYNPRDRGGTHAQGAWGIQGTDPEMVNRMAGSVGSLLQGRQGFLGILGTVLTSLPGSSGTGGPRGAIEDEGSDDYDDDRQRRRRHRRRREGDD